MFRRKKIVLSKQVDGVWLILQKDKIHVRRLNEVAGFLWGNLSNWRSEENLVNDLVSAFEVAKEVAKQDVMKWLEEYVRLDFLEKK